MKSSAFAFCLLLALAPIGLNAQYSARQLTRKIVPQQQQQPPARPVQPAPAAPVIIAPAVVHPATPQPESDRVRANREESVKKAVEFQKKRAEEGSPQAQYDLGVRYLKGDGVEKNEILGREWLQKAAKNGNIHAQRKLDELPKLPDLPPGGPGAAPAAAPIKPAEPAAGAAPTPAPAPDAPKAPAPAPAAAPVKN